MRSTLWNKWSIRRNVCKASCVTWEIQHVYSWACVWTLSPFLSLSSKVNCEFIHIASLVHRGTEGKPLHLPVETRFQLDEAEIQGTWSHTTPSGTRSTLVTFTKDTAITDMMYRNHLFFREPNISLLIQKLNRDDEGDYHLNLNIEFHNKTGLFIKEERTVHVTVDGKWINPVICQCLLDRLSPVVCDNMFDGHYPKFTKMSRYFLSPRVHCGHYEEPIVRRCWGQSERYLDVFRGKRNKGWVPVAEEERAAGSQWQIPLLQRQLDTANQSCEERRYGNLPLCGQQSSQPGPEQQGHGTQCLLWVDLHYLLPSPFSYLQESCDL